MHDVFDIEIRNSADTVYMFTFCDTLYMKIRLSIWQGKSSTHSQFNDHNQADNIEVIKYLIEFDI